MNESNVTRYLKDFAVKTYNKEAEVFFITEMIQKPSYHGYPAMITQGLSCHCTPLLYRRLKILSVVQIFYDLRTLSTYLDGC